MLPWSASVEDVKAAPDWKESARNTAQIRRALEASTRSVERLCHRKFYPELATRYFDWPDLNVSLPWRLWLNQYEVIYTTSLVSGGTTIASGNYNLEPVNEGPPYDRIEMNISTQAAFSSGSTHQRAIAVAGLFGYNDDSDPAGALAAGVGSATTTTADVTDSSQDTGVGVGNLLQADAERMVVTAKTMISTAQTLGGAGLTAAKNSVTVPVSDGTTYHVGETILLDSERMLIVDIAGNNLTVVRAHDGTVLATHTTGTTIYAPRRLTVTRGALGTTAATHSNGATISRHTVPGLVRQLTVAETLRDILQETGGYGAGTGPMPSGGGSKPGRRQTQSDPLDDLRARCYAAHGRKARIRAV